MLLMHNTQHHRCRVLSRGHRRNARPDDQQEDPRGQIHSGHLHWTIGIGFYLLVMKCCDLVAL